MHIPLTEVSPLARIARLMLDPPEFIEPEYLAETKANMKGELQLDVMQRLRELLHSNAGAVTFNLDFHRDEAGFACITGEFRANLELVCQRCLQPFTSELSDTISTGICAAEEQLVDLDKNFEPLILTEKELLLAGFIEDEVLLSMPLAAAHKSGVCPGEKLLESNRVTKKKPFAVLKSLNLKDS